MNAASEFDLGPLTWVKGEIDQALERADEALRQYDANTDLTQVKFCRTHIHQVHGALSIVGLDGLTQVSDALEALLLGIEEGRVTATAESMRVVKDAVSAIRQYLDDLMAGEPNQPLRLLPIYERLCDARGHKPRVSDLFFPDLAVRPPKRSTAVVKLEPEAFKKLLKAERMRFQKGLLAWLKNPPESTVAQRGLNEMRGALGTIESTQDSPQARSFWWISLGFLDALADQGVASEQDAKQLCARIDLQIRRLLDGSRNVAERLMRDALFFVGHANTANGELAAQVRSSFRLDKLVPPEGAVAPAAAPQESALRKLREVILAAEEFWNKFCAGSATAINGFTEQSRNAAQLAETIGQADLKRLAQNLATCAAWLSESPSRHTDGVAMEVATAILLLQNAQENFKRLGNDFAQQVDHMVARLQACISGTPLDAGAEVPLLDEMTRRAQEKLLITQVAREIQNNLAQIEQSLDAFFRDPSNGLDAKALDGPIKQISGALTILGHEKALASLAACGDQIRAFGARGYVANEADFEAVAQQLSTIGFFIDALQSGTTDFEIFSRKLRGEEITSDDKEPEEPAQVTRSVESEVEKAKGNTQALVAALKAAPEDSQLKNELKQNLQNLQKDADLVADHALGESAKAALSALESGSEASVDELANALATLKPTQQEAPTPSAETLQLAQASHEELDAELLEIFLEEAHEVLAAVASETEALHAQPDDVDTLTNIRRAMHTLKGSGRMVGLKDLGEAAWSVEQTLNMWLRQELQITPEIFDLLAQSHHVFSVWVKNLDENTGQVPDPSAMVALSDRLRSADSAVTEAPTAAEPPAPAPAPEAASSPAEEIEEDVPPELAATMVGMEAILGPDNEPEEPIDPELDIDFSLDIPSAPGEEALSPPQGSESTVADLTTEAPTETTASAEQQDAEIDFSFDLDGPSDEAREPSAESIELPAGSSDDSSPAERVSLAETAEAPAAPGDFNFDFALDDTASAEDSNQAVNAEPVAEASADEPEPEVLAEADAEVVEFAVSEEDIHIEESDEAALETLPTSDDLSLDAQDLSVDFEDVTPSEEAADDSLALDVSEAEPEEAEEGVTDAAIEADLTEAAGITDLEVLDAEPLVTEADEPLAPEEEATVEAVVETFDQPESVQPTEDPPVSEAPSPTLYDIFREEARGHLDTLAHSYRDLETNPAGPTTFAMTRAAHTLGGIAATVGLASIQSLAIGLEHALLRRDHSARPDSIEGLEVVRQSILALAEMYNGLADQLDPQPQPQLIEALEEIFPVVVPEVELAPAGAANDVSIDESVEASEAAPAPSSEIVTDADYNLGRADLSHEIPQLQDDLDEQLLPIFLEEATDIVRELAEQFRAWRENVTGTEAPQSVARLLHTLKGGARMAGAMNLGEMTHALETRLEEVLESGAFTPAVVDEIEAGCDTLTLVVERAVRGEPPTLPTAAPAADADEEAGLAPDLAPGADAEAPQEVHKAVEIQAAPVAAVSEPEAQRAMLRVRADLIDRLVNEAGELSIARARIEGEMRSLKTSLLDLTENVIRLRRQLREVEIQAETQMQSRIALAEEAHQGFDPLEFDRFTRFQELTRFMAESVNDVATVQQTLLKNLDDANAAIIAQARLNRGLQQELMGIRMIPFASQTDRLYRIVRQTAKELGKRANLEIRGGHVELDRSVMDKMLAPVEHMLRNAVNHGIEERDVRAERGKSEIGEITLALRQEGNEIVISMGDDGGGLDPARIRARAETMELLAPGEEADDARLFDFIFHPGFSTAAAITHIAGRGVGMDVVKTEVANLGGRIEITSQPGKGTTFTLYLPLTLAVTQTLLLRTGSSLFAVPSTMIEQVLELKEEGLADIRKKGEAAWLGNRYPFHFLPHLLGDLEALPESHRRYRVLLLRSGTQRAAILVDELKGNQEVVIKNIGPQLARVSGISGATVLGDGRVVLILNPVMLAARLPGIAVAAPVGAHPSVPATAAPVAATLPTVMVVDDSLTVRKITSRLLSREGYQVILAKDGVDALEHLIDTVPDVMLSDIEMPRMDGFDLVRNVRADERLKDLPIIMITSRTADKHRNYAIEIGANEYLGKPYDEETLLGMIARFVREKQSA